MSVIYSSVGGLGSTYTSVSFTVQYRNVFTAHERRLLWMSGTKPKKYTEKISTITIKISVPHRGHTRCQLSVKTDPFRQADRHTHTHTRTHTHWHRCSWSITCLTLKLKNFQIHFLYLHNCLSVGDIYQCKMLQTATPLWPLTAAWHNQLAQWLWHQAYQSHGGGNGKSPPAVSAGLPVLECQCHSGKSSSQITMAGRFCGSLRVCSKWNSYVLLRKSFFVSVCKSHLVVSLFGDPWARSRIKVYGF